MSFSWQKREIFLIVVLYPLHLTDHPTIFLEIMRNPPGFGNVIGEDVAATALGELAIAAGGAVGQRRRSCWLLLSCKPVATCSFAPEEGNQYSRKVRSGYICNGLSLNSAIGNI